MLYVNNEVGTISDVETASSICKKNNIALHADLTQALGKIKIDVKKWELTMLHVRHIKYTDRKE